MGDKKAMTISWELFAWLGPVAIGYCIYRGIKSNRARRLAGVPPWLVVSIKNMNGSDRKYGAK